MIEKTLCVLLLALCLGALSPSRADTTILPDTPAGNQLRELTAAINTGNEAVLRDFAATHFSPALLREKTHDGLARLLLNIFRRSARLEWDAVYPQTDTYIGGFAWGKQGIYKKPTGTKIFIRLETLAQPPFLINQYEVRPAEPSLDAILPILKPGASESERLKLIEHGAANAAAADRLSGTVLIACKGKILFKHAYGEADKSLRVPNHLDTSYSLASVGKLFTTVAIAQLVSQGKLAYDTPISRYLPDYPNPMAAAKITLHHLLTHTSGLGDIFGPGKDDPNRHLRHLSDYLPLFAEEPLQFEPGHGNAYSNAGFIVLSLIVEQVSGQQFEDYLRDHIFRPAGMTGISYNAIDQITLNRATGYLRDYGDDPLNPTSIWKNNLPFLVSLGTGPASGAGGGSATAADLFKFANGLTTHKLLSAAALDQLIQNGYGFEVGNSNGHQRYGHTGAGPGMNASLFLYPDQNYTVIVLSNYDPAFAQVFGERIGEILTKP